MPRRISTTFSDYFIKISYGTSSTSDFYIQNVDTGMVLDVHQERKAGPTPVVMWTYKASDNQHWTYRNHMIYSKLNGMVLDVSPEGHLIINPSHGGPNQQWYFKGKFIRCGNEKYLDIAGANRKAGARTITYEKNSSWNQKFRIVYL